MTAAAWRIFRVIIAMVMLVALPASLLLERSLSQDLVQRIESDLTSRATMARTLGSGLSIDELDDLAKTIGKADEVRFTWVGPDGQVLGDSWVDREELNSLDNHADRPEIKAAQRNGLGIARRSSETTGADLLYVAVRGDPAHGGTVRVAMPLTGVDEAVASLRAALFTVGVLVFALAIAGSILAARRVHRDFESLVHEASKLADEEDTMTADLLAASLDDDDDDDDDHDQTEQEELARIELRSLEDRLAEAVRSLAEQRDLVKAVLDGISDGVISLTGGNRVAIANAAAIELLGWKKVPKGKRIQKRVPPALWEHIQEIREFGPTLAEITFERKTVEVASAQLTKGKGIVVVLRDVTELRRLERVRRDFVANVSHELGTPVAVIRANTETLLDGGAIDDERGRLLFTEAIDRQAHRLSALISDLLQISRIEAGELIIEMQEVSLSESFLAVVESTSPDAEKRQVSIVAEPTDLVIRADARALHSILENLVSNAIKYGNSKVVLSARPEGPRTRISVGDDGPGIPEEHRERVFERFYRVDKGRSREVGGTGLGLSIVRNLVHAMGGEVGVDSSEDGGAAFWIAL